MVSYLLKLSKVLVCRLLIGTLVLGFYCISSNAQQQVVVHVSPSRSSISSYTTGSGIQLDISPTIVQVTGNITLQVLSYSSGSPRQPLEYAWVSSTLNIVPDVLQITAKLPVGDIQVAQVSVKGVTLNGAHGPFTPEASTGNFSCTPSNVAVTLSRIAGSVGGNLVDDMNVRISPPTAVLPIVSGKLHAVGGRIFLSAASTPRLVLRDWVMESPYDDVVGDSAVSFIMTIAGNSVLPLQVLASGSAPSRVRAPGPAPVAAPGPSPVRAPGPAPVAAPGPAPVRAPGPSPIAAPGPAPVAAPRPAPKGPVPGPGLNSSILLI